MIEIILAGDVRFKRRWTFCGMLTFFLFQILPIALLVGTFATIIIYIARNSGGGLWVLFQLIIDLLQTRTGWFFANGETFRSVYQSNILDYTIRMLPAALILFLGNGIREQQCPYCGHYLTMKRISGDRFQHSKKRQVSSSYYDYGDGLFMDNKGQIYYGGVTTKQKQYGVETRNYYHYNVQCSCCGCVARKQTSHTSTDWN